MCLFYVDHVITDLEPKLPMWFNEEEEGEGGVMCIVNEYLC